MRGMLDKNVNAMLTTIACTCSIIFHSFHATQFFIFLSKSNFLFLFFFLYRPIRSNVCRKGHDAIQLHCSSTNLVFYTIGVFFKCVASKQIFYCCTECCTKSLSTSNSNVGVCKYSIIIPWKCCVNTVLLYLGSVV